MIDYNLDLTDKISYKYPNDVPKDYDVSPIQYTYDFVYLVFKRDASIDSAIRGVANEYNLSESELNDFLIENKYILNKTNKNEFSKQLKKYNTKSLKKILKKYGLKTSGKREKIEQRIFEHKLLGSDYYLSSKSRIFYKNKRRRVRIFEKYLFEYYYFKEFNEFYMDNYRKREEKIPIAFIDRHISKSVENKNHKLFCLNNQIMAQHFKEKENFKKMLEYTLNDYCINLNPVWKLDDLKNHEGLCDETYDNLIFLNDKIGKNRIISAYFAIWNSFNFEKILVPKYAGYKYLKKILNDYNCQKINEDLNNNFYLNDDVKIKTITQKTLFDF